MSSDAVENIMDGTHSALRAHGYAELTMQDIADEAGVSKSALHYHFDCKHDLLVSFLDRLLAQFEARIDDPPGDDPAERLAALVEMVVSPPDDDAPYEFRTALLEIEAQAPYDDDFRSRLRRFDEALTERVRSLVAAGVDDGTFRDDVDPDRTASFVLTYVRGARVRNVAVGTPLDESLTAFHDYLRRSLLAEGVEVATE